MIIEHIGPLFHLNIVSFFKKKNNPIFCKLNKYIAIQFTA